ncbi:deoxyuridine 5'-triphosphate nucleotidohydrolase [Pseudoalteromonas phage C7]|uniref:dUTPase n=1 Tax=Pseudoalteromonas phage C7 TaxID=2510494 RepID=UPI0010189941|nr:dUTPase [Pseudoalteromonas phage C7]QAY18013.1 deoxyuridine 5'-triphosphate nucleotidohydrolase [Pseudoalteromonas phage C7]
MIPTHQTDKSAGADLYAAETVTIEPNQVRLIGTGFSLPNYNLGDLVFMLCNRSSIALKKQLMVCNGVGVIDQDYKDEIKVMFINLSGEPQTITKGERISQLVPMRYVTGLFGVEGNERVGGFGSTNNAN